MTLVTAAATWAAVRISPQKYIHVPLSSLNDTSFAFPITRHHNQMDLIPTPKPAIANAISADTAMLAQPAITKDSSIVESTLADTGMTDSPSKIVPATATIDDKASAALPVAIPIPASSDATAATTTITAAEATAAEATAAATEAATAPVEATAESPTETPTEEAPNEASTEATEAPTEVPAEVPTEIPIEIPADFTDASIPPPPPLSTSLSSASSLSSSPPTPPPSMGPSFYTWSTSSDYEARVYEYPPNDDECYASPYPIVVMTKHRGFLWNEEMFVTARRYKAAATAQAESTGEEIGEEGIRREEVVEIKLEEWECDIWPV